MATIQDYETRLGVLRRELEQTLKLLATYDGAMQECEHWLQKAQEEASAQQAASGVGDDVV